MNRRTALSAIGVAGLCPTAAMAIPEKKENPDGLPVVEFGDFTAVNNVNKLLINAEKIICFDNHAVYRIKIWVNKINSASIALLPEFRLIGCTLEDLIGFEASNHRCWGSMILYIRTLNGMLYNYWLSTDGFTTNITL